MNKQRKPCSSYLSSIWKASVKMSIFKDHNKPTRNTVPELHGNCFYVLCGSYCCFLVLSKADFYPFTVSNATRNIRIKKCLYLRHCNRDLPTGSDCNIDRICGVWIVLLSVIKLSKTVTVKFHVFCRSSYLVHYVYLKTFRLMILIL
jgi:hypothetical protein